MKLFTYASSLYSYTSEDTFRKKCNFSMAIIGLFPSVVFPEVQQLLNLECRILVQDSLTDSFLPERRAGKPMAEHLVAWTEALEYAKLHT